MCISKGHFLKLGKVALFPLILHFKINNCEIHGLFILEFVDTAPSEDNWTRNTEQLVYHFSVITEIQIHKWCSQSFLFSLPAAGSSVNIMQLN